MNEAGGAEDVSCKYKDVVPTLEWPIAEETHVSAAPPLRLKVAKQCLHEWLACPGKPASMNNFLNLL